MTDGSGEPISTGSVLRGSKTDTSILVLQPTDRLRLLNEALDVKNQTGRSMPVRFENGYSDCPVFCVPNAALFYRFENGRIVAERDRALREAGLDPNGSIEPDSVAVQQVLHTQLFAHAADPDGPILNELARFGRQIEPLIATRDGTVVNGNRRLAAMRHLTATEPDLYASFETIDVAFLPTDISDASIEYLEASLQMAPDTKLAYGWANRRMKLRRQREVLKLPVDRILDAYRMEDAAQLQREIDELALAETYLVCKAVAGGWSALGGGFELIEAYNVQRTTIPKGIRDVWQTIAFLLIEQRSEVDPEKSFPFAPPFSAELPRLALAEIAIALELAGPGSKPASNDELASAVERGGVREAEEIVSLIAYLRQRHLDNTAPTRALKQLRQAGATLQRLDPYRFTDVQQRQLRSDLAALSAQVEYILGNMDGATRKGSWNSRKKLLDPPYGKVPFRIWRRLQAARGDS